MNKNEIKMSSSARVNGQHVNKNRVNTVENAQLQCTISSLRQL